MILVKDKNRLLAAVQETGLDATLFVAGAERIAGRRAQYFVIRLRNSNILFAVKNFRDFRSFVYYRSQFTPGFPLGGEHLSVDVENLAKQVGKWIEQVVKPYLEEASTPDLWTVVNEIRTRASLGGESASDLEPFSAEEKTQLRRSVKEFRLLVVKHFDPAAERLAALNARIDYLTAAIDKHNRFDWRGVAINTVLAIIIALSLSPEQGARLWELFRQAFSRLLFLGSG